MNMNTDNTMDLVLGEEDEATWIALKLSPALRHESGYHMVIPNSWSIASSVESLADLRTFMGRTEQPILPEPTHKGANLPSSG